MLGINGNMMFAGPVCACVCPWLCRQKEVHLSDFLFSHLHPDSHGHLLLGNVLFTISHEDNAASINAIAIIFKQSIQPPVWSCFFWFRTRRPSALSSSRGWQGFHSIMIQYRYFKVGMSISLAGMVTSCIIKLGESRRQLGAQSVSLFFFSLYKLAH